YLLAYKDLSYFNRLFKKITGVTPQQYRELYKK
ncbi:helix-turn-helix domain-containing protein, partial [Phocaeicola dorei]